MSFFKKLFKERKMFGLYRDDKSFYNSFIDQVINIFSFSSSQEPFKAASEDEIWKEVDKTYLHIRKNMNNF